MELVLRCGGSVWSAGLVPRWCSIYIFTLMYRKIFAVWEYKDPAPPSAGSSLLSLILYIPHSRSRSLLHQLMSESINFNFIFKYQWISTRAMVLVLMFLCDQSYTQVAAGISCSGATILNSVRYPR